MPCIGQNSDTIYVLENPPSSASGLQARSYDFNNGVVSPPITIEAATNFSLGSLCTFSNETFFLTGQVNGSPVLYSTRMPVIDTSPFIAFPGFAAPRGNAQDAAAAAAATFPSFLEFNSMTSIPDRSGNDCVVLSGANQAIVTCAHANAIMLDLEPGIAGILGLDNRFELLVFYRNYTLAIDFRLATDAIQRGVAFSPRSTQGSILRTYEHPPGTEPVPLIGKVVQVKNSDDPSHVDLLLIDSKRDKTSELYRMSLDTLDQTVQMTRYNLPTSSVSSTWHDISFTVLDPGTTTGRNATVYFVGTGANQHDLVTHAVPLAELAASSSSSSSSGMDSRTMAAAVAGAIVGLVICVLSVICLCFRRRIKSWRRQQQQTKPLLPAFDTEKKNMDDHVIIRLELPRHELEKLGPFVEGEIAILEGRYRLQPQNGPDSVAGSDTGRAIPMREATDRDGRLQTIHYFSDSKVFLRCVRTTTTAAAAETSSIHMIKTSEAIHLTRRTPQGFRYLWITSPSPPDQSLGHVIQHRPAAIHFEDMAFKAWTTYILLEALRDLHQQVQHVHLGLTPSCFHYVDINHVTAWRLAGFYQTCQRGSPLPKDIKLNAWSAPEITSHLTRLSRQPQKNKTAAAEEEEESFETTAQPAMDIWSLGCIIWMLATGHRHLPHLNSPTEIAIACKEAAAVHEAFGPLLRDMIHLDPNARKPAAALAAYWKDALNLLDDVQAVVVS
ncbi:hypothetical protein BX666DRAFT_1437772 [Dichotomocladium elegans]|nr:hypothetical protein BX666DRAFT_1437772 [Dichotomocladium elegans]